MKKIIAPIVFLSGLLSSFSAFSTNGALDYGFSEITRGMGGAGSALPQDSLIAAVNPAGMVDVGPRIDVGATFYVPSNGYSATSFSPASIGPGNIGIAPGYHNSDISAFFLPDLGMNIPINQKSSLGVSLYSLAGFGTEYRTNAEATVGIPGVGPVQEEGPAGGGVFSSDLKQAVTSITYSRKFLSHSSFGLSLLLGTQTLSVKGLQNLGALSVSSRNVSNDGTDYSVGGGARVGVLFGVLPTVNLGLSYQPEMAMTKFDHYRGLLPDGGEFNIPPYGNIGLDWTVIKTVNLAFDVEKIWYTAIPAYGASQNALLNGNCFSDNSTCLGGANGAGFGWGDDVIYKIGAQWQVTPETALRAGYNRSDQVLPHDYGPQNMLIPGAVIRNLYTVGATQKISKTDSLNGMVIYIPKQSFTSSNLYSGAANQLITTSLSGFGFGMSWSRAFA